MTAEPIWDQFHEAVERLPTARARRILRLVIDELDAEVRHVELPGTVAPGEPLSWSQLQSSAVTLPPVDHARFRADLGDVIDDGFTAGADT